MIQGLPLFPIWTVDIAGSILMILFAFMSIYHAVKVSRRDPDNLLWSYLVVLALAFSAFSLGRGIGHIAQIVLVTMGRQSIWEQLAPVSGALNTMTFIIVASVTFFYQRVEGTFFLVQKYNRMITEAYEKLEKAYQEIKANQDKIIHLERQAIASRVTSTLAHETRNPILAIGGFARILKQKLSDNPDLLVKISIILEETEKLEQLVDGILKAGRDATAEFHAIDVYRLLESVCEAVRGRTHLAGVDIRMEVEPGWANVVVDKESIVMALKEILLNAIEASPKEGEVILQACREAQYVVIVITDHGQGISPEIRARMYEPFFSTKKLSSGLGLSFAKKIIEMHNGYLQFTTEPEKGTTFRAYLPMSS